MLLLHGDNHITSRQALLDYIEEKSNVYTRTESYNASQLTVASLEAALGETSLFNDQKLIIIEELHSLPKSTKKTSLIDLLARSQDLDSVVLWEKKPLTAKQLSVFGKSRVKTFKASSSVFRWLDQVSPKTKPGDLLQLFAEAVEGEGEEFCLLMLVRQIRLLLQVKSNGNPAVAPFIKRKLQQQASQFTLDQLLAFHEQLVVLDAKRKRGQSPLSLKQQLDLLQLWR